MTDDDLQQPSDDSAEAHASPVRARRWRRRVAIAGLVLALAVGASYVGTAVMHVPPPHTLARLLTTAPSEQGELFAAREVAPAEQPRALPTATGETLPERVSWKGKEIPLERVLTDTHTRGFLVLHHGRVVDDWYADGVGDTTRFSSWSVAKSVVSLLVGQAIGRGELSEDDRLVDLVPKLRTGKGYDAITLRDLLDMASGVDVAENYREWWPFTGTARLFLSTDLPGYLVDHRGLRFEPGSKGEYRSVDTQLLGMVLREVTGSSLAALLERDLWQPAGAAAAATWNLDHDGGVEKAFCCLNATVPDFARIGQLVLDRGVVDGRQVVPEAWIDRISTPAPHAVSDWGYSAQWWHPEGADDDFTAIGIHGQYIFVDPDTHTVIVKVSDHGTEQDELDTVQVMREIAVHLGG